ncbi:hypothetical protein ETU08_04820 [Apibacter muscae]|uniref:GDSL-type esterase/lipase family protein n=1 Tax=Apibacter muscae TaxID=2509004 RepID=UPI0011ACF7BF|nr:GDSL-type esterase/lipase family protein [Apibacter muscae]TWP30421.1 hypothetical protein ETU08_04820 [Apibacter muscae]
MKDIKITKSFYFFIVAFLFGFQYGCSQLTIENTYSFVQENKNVIHNSQELQPFFKKLDQASSRKINILHIGDSHLQPNQITQVPRKQLQKVFGNAGRGLIVPYKVAGTNSPDDIISTSQFKWEGKRNCKPLIPQPTGIGGISLKSLDSASTFIFRLPHEYAFSSMTVFFENDGKSYDLFAKDLIHGEVINLKNFIDEKNPNVSKIKFSQPTNEVEILSLKTSLEQTHTTILGINTENEENGIVYHSIGVNGAEYYHYDTSEYFNEETPFLNPDLIIISLGTNEAFRKNFDEEDFKSEVHKFITNLRKYNPEVPFLITTPANSYINKKYQNPKLKRVRDILVAYCKENQLAFWDLQEITGNAQNWKNNQLISKDLIHYNAKGYRLQGELLYNALINSYKEYVTTK